MSSHVALAVHKTQTHALSAPVNHGNLKNNKATLPCATNKLLLPVVLFKPLCLTLKIKICAFPTSVQIPLNIHQNQHTYLFTSMYMQTLTFMQSFWNSIHGIRLIQLANKSHKQNVVKSKKCPSKQREINHPLRDYSPSAT